MNKITVSLLSLACSLPLHANPIELIGSDPHVITVHHQAQSGALTRPQSKVVYLQRLILSSEAKRILEERVLHEHVSDLNPEVGNAPLPKAVNLGLNGTPILDQGEHGTCVTFASTGAIDSVLGHGDYVSQFASLELGSYLVKINKIPVSGWEGSTGSTVLNQLTQYGVVPKSQQVGTYPLNDPDDTGTPMSIAQYTAKSVLPSNPKAKWAWGTIVSAQEVFRPNYDPNTTLVTIKKNLAKGNHITIGILLDSNPNIGDGIGAVGDYHAQNDAWIYTTTLDTDLKKGLFNLGHQVHVIGYDDTAVVRDPITKQADTGLFKVANSWGENAGHGGYYYISYNYAKHFLNEAQFVGIK